MASLIRRYPEVLEKLGDSFQTLCRAIVGQQISIRAADSVWDRLRTVAGIIDPPTIDGLSLEQLRRAGLSRSKAQYLKNVARFFLDRQIGDPYWQQRPLQTIRQELLSIKGVGNWTVEMFAIFHLQEPDIFSPGDTGVQKAIAALYFEGNGIERSQLEAFASRWQPYRTVALWYLWRYLDPVPVIY